MADTQENYVGGLETMIESKCSTPINVSWSNADKQIKQS